MKIFRRLKKVLAPESSPEKLEAEPVPPQPNATSAEAPQEASPAETGSLSQLENDPRRRILCLSRSPYQLPELDRLMGPLREGWRVLFMTSEQQALELAQAAPFEVLICEGDSSKPWTQFLAQFAQVCPRTVPFVRAPINDVGWMQAFGAKPPHHLPAELEGEPLVDFITRLAYVNFWMANPQVQKLLGQMKHLPSMPSIYSQVLAELNKPEGSLNFVGMLISKDPALTAKMLQCVNSAAFALARQIADPMEAVMFLGTERTKALLLASSLLLNFRSTCPGFDLEQWWLHSVAIGGMARSIATSELRDSKLADMAFTAGLLHDAGKLLLAANLPEVYGRILDQVARGRLSVEQVEREFLGSTHAEIGACFLGGWGLPFSILSAVAWHHAPRQSGDLRMSVLTAVHAADAIDNEKRLQSHGLKVNRFDLEYMTQVELRARPNRWRQTFGCLTKSDHDLFEKDSAVQKAA